MSIAESFLPEFDHEIAQTRRILERVADDKLDWKPHPKSMSLRRLASHLAQLPQFATLTFRANEYDLVPKPGQMDFESGDLESRDAILALLERTAADARASLVAATDSALPEPWTLFKGGHQILQMPRVAVYRIMVMNHLCHHRGQLSVYLRLLDIPVPGLYGPSSDEASGH